MQAAEGKIVLFIDEIHLVLGERSPTDRLTELGKLVVHSGAAPPRVTSQVDHILIRVKFARPLGAAFNMAKL